MKIVKIFSSFNLFGGTPMKILEIGRWSCHNVVYYLYEKYAPEDQYITFKKKFVDTNRVIVEKYFNRLIILHLYSFFNDKELKKADVIHTYFSFGQLLGYLIKKINPNLKWVVSFVTPDKPDKYKSFLLNSMYGKLDGVIYITEYVRKEKETQFPVLKSLKSKVIYNGATIRQIESSVNKRSELELLTVGGLVGWKNTVLLLEVANILKNKGVKFNLTIIGNGPLFSDIDKKIKKNNLCLHVHLVGYTTNVGGYLDACDIYLHPSLTEGFGIAVAEAMFFSKPILVANAGALPELVENSINGFVLDPHSAEDWSEKIIQLYENNALKNLMGENSLRIAKAKFSIKSFVENHDVFYEDLSR